MPQENTAEEPSTGTRGNGGLPVGRESPGDEDVAATNAANGIQAGNAESVSPDEYADRLIDLARRDPTEAGDRIGDLLAISRTGDEEVREAVGEVLDLIGWYRPEEFEVWVDDLVSIAESREESLSFLGLRALAQLAGANPTAAAKGLQAAVDRLNDHSPALRQAALAIVAEVGEEFPERVRQVDRPVAGALHDESPAVRMAGAMAAGRLLGAEPSRFPRTARALVDSVEDDDPEVREYVLVALAHFARSHPSNVPDRTTVIKALAAASDAELGLREGSTNEALSELLTLALGTEIRLR